MQTSKNVLLILVSLLFLSEGNQAQTVTDYDGNVYNSVTIGTQVWLRENLKSLHYSDGAAINEVWAYNNSDSLAAIYGRLYSWQAAMRGAASSNQVPSGIQGVCPSGWHLPSSEEWYILVNRFGGESQAGAYLKETGTAHWNLPNTGANNESGFTALPGGFHYQPGGGFGVMGATGGWFTSYNDGGYVYSIYMGSESLGAIQFGTWQGGGYNFEDMSVRCLKDGGSTGINEVDHDNSFSVFPNPANDYVNIRFENNMNAEVIIYDLNGKSIIQKKLNQQETRINIGDLPEGVYFVSVKSPKAVSIKKIFKIQK